MNDRDPSLHALPLRIIAPLAVVAAVIAGATAGFASGGSAPDTPRDLRERGVTPTSPTTSTTTLPREANADRGADNVFPDPDDTAPRSRAS